MRRIRKRRENRRKKVDCKKGENRKERKKKKILEGKATMKNNVKKEKSEI